MSQSVKTLRQDFIDNKDDKDYRNAYADESLNITIATQIKVLREQRGWYQKDLADKANMKQSMISRFEDVNYASWSISTLKRLAEAFDVILDVRFRSFKDLVIDTCSFSRESLQVPEFRKDQFFEEKETGADSDSILNSATPGTSQLIEGEGAEFGALEMDVTVVAGNSVLVGGESTGYAKVNLH
jgi:transcriptional regulator with XRE-family HTH domain